MSGQLVEEIERLKQRIRELEGSLDDRDRAMADLLDKLSDLLAEE